MKTSLPLTILAASLAAVAIAGHASQPQAAPGGVITEQRPVGAFSAIQLDGPFEATVHAQGKNAVEVSGLRRDLDDIETFVRGDTLVVRSKPHLGFHFVWGRQRDVAHVTISAAMLKNLTLSGSGNADVDQLSGDKLTLAIEGPGDLHASGAVRELTVRSSGPGDADLRSLASANLVLTMSGPGNVLVSGVGNELTANVSGPGDLAADNVHLARLITHMSGPGNVKLSGSARELQAEVTGSGDLEACGVAVQAVHALLDGPGNACVSGTITQFDAEVHGPGDLTARGLQAQLARVRMSGPGDVTLTGNAARLDAKLSGPGDLLGRGLIAGRADITVTGPGSAQVQVLPPDARSAGKTSLMVVDRGGMRQRPANMAD